MPPGILDIEIVINNNERDKCNIHRRILYMGTDVNGLHNRWMLDMETVVKDLKFPQ